MTSLHTYTYIKYRLCHLGHFIAVISTKIRNGPSSVQAGLISSIYKASYFYSSLGFRLIPLLTASFSKDNYP